MNYSVKMFFLLDALIVTDYTHMANGIVMLTLMNEACRL